MTHSYYIISFGAIGIRLRCTRGREINRSDAFRLKMKVICEQALTRINPLLAVSTILQFGACVADLLCLTRDPRPVDPHTYVYGPSGPYFHLAYLKMAHL